MPFKSSAGKLFDLLEKCCESDNEFIKKNLYIEKIISDKNYIQITDIKPEHDYFRNFFSRDRLMNMPYEKLSEIYECLDLIPKCIDKLKNSICYGNGYTLTENDFPDFTSKRSIEKLYIKLNIDDPSFNYTNIKPNDYFQIFSNETVKNAEKFINSLCIDDIKNINELLNKEFGSKKYCINGELIERRKTVLFEEQDDMLIKELREKLRKRSKKRLRITLAVSGIIIFAVAISVYFIF